MSSHTAGVTVPDRFRSINPATGELLQEWGAFTDGDVESALARAHAAFLEWRDIPVDRRAALLLAMADLIDRDREALARQSTLEMGKPIAQARSDADGAAGILRYYAELGPRILADEPITVSGFSRTVVRREPTGIILGIEPWNAPLRQAIRAAAPNLMLGNTVLLKPSEITPGTTSLFDPLFREAGFPDGAYQTVLVSRQQVASIIADDRVRGVTLTGSDRAGSAVGAQASEHIKPVVLELGGSDGCIVLDSADVAKAAAIAATCRLIIGGQACALPKRVIVTETVADAFIEQYLPYFTSQVIGDPLEPATTLGPLSTVAAAQRLQEQYDDAVSRGATVLAPGGRMDGPGAFFRPAVITDVTPEMRVYAEEAFGPLGIIFRVPDADAAIELANATKYGLGGSVFAEDLDEADRVARRLDTGGVGINTFLGAPVEIPFGGTKSSGVGRELGRSGMEAFANIKTYAA